MISYPAYRRKYSSACRILFSALHMTVFLQRTQKRRVKAHKYSMKSEGIFAESAEFSELTDC